MSFPVTITMYRLFIFLFQMMHTFEFLIASDVLQSHTQRRLVDGSGFISIDCGFPSGEYYYQPWGFYYTSDEKYISSGKNSEISPTYVKMDPEDPYTTLRSFPEGCRNCYTLSPLKPNNQYLIRAQFMYGNYDGQNALPGFDVYIGVNFWFTLALEGPSQKHFKEIIHVATSDSIDVCLVNTGHGTPFISVLELRPLDISSYPATPHFSLNLYDRDDVGSVASEPNIYYNLEDDTYDRKWRMAAPIWKTGYKRISTNISIEASQANPNKIPTSVLGTACEAKNNLANIAIHYSPTNDPITQVYGYWYFAELELFDEKREFNIYIPGYNKLGPITPKYLQLTTISSPRISLNGSEVVRFTLAKTNTSNLSPILNAYEIYTVLELPVLPTNQQDVDAITMIKDKYVVPRIWQGDPCLPKNYQWDGLNCTYNANNPPTITSLSLSSSNLTGELPPSLIKLTSLKYLNLSNNNFTGKIPTFLAYLPLLRVIDLSGNELTGPIPRELVEKASNKSIDLRLQGNPDVCKSYPCEEKMEVNMNRNHYIIPVVTCVAIVVLIVIIGIVFFALKGRKKQEGLIDRNIKSRNKQFNFSDIVRFTDNFRKVLGKGGFGTVYYGVLQDGTQVAVKVLDNTSSTITLKQFCAEAELLMRIHHVNLVTLIGYCDEHTNIALVYEFMSCGNLQMHLSERNEHPLSWKARLQISIDAAQGLEYLHSGCRPPIIHRDIKPANILLDEMGHAKIADFGLSRFYTTNSQGVVTSTDFAGTRGYLDPEYCQMVNALSEKSDVYAFGIVLLQMLTGQPALIKNTNEGSEPIHIDHWVSPMVESGDILAIVDKRLQGYRNANSAWQFLEIAIECVKPTGNQRPRMSEVVSDLKMCFASEGFGEQSNPNSASSGNYSMNSSQALENKSLVSLPDPR